jgi:hypothetical protein
LLVVGEQLIGLGGGGLANAHQGVQGQAETGLALGAGALVDRAQVVETEQGPDLADRFAAGRARIEGLVEKGPEGATEGEDAVAAVGAVVGLGQQAGRDEAAEEQLQVEEALLAELLDAGAQGGQACAELRKEGCVHAKYIYLSSLDVQDKMIPMKKNASSLRAWERHYARLRQSLAPIGYISQGSVLDRSPLKSGRTGYQWTRKVAQKTITVSLSLEQFRSFKQAIENMRKLWKTLEQMERLSRQILFATVPDTRRRKPLGKKVLGLI